MNGKEDSFYTEYRVLINALFLLVRLASVIAIRQYSKQRIEGAVTDSYAIMLAGAEEQFLDFQKHGEQNTNWGGAAGLRATVYTILVLVRIPQYIRNMMF